MNAFVPITDDASSSRLQACMGGWCKVRTNCARYHSTFRLNPAERMCAADDRFIVWRSAGTWERSQAANGLLAKPHPMEITA